MILKIFNCRAKINYFVVLSSVATILLLQVLAVDDFNNTNSNLQMNMDFQKAQQRLMQILQEPSFSWVLEKLAQTQGKPSHNTHAPFDGARSVETNKDNLLKENFDPDDRRSLLHANHAIAHLMYQGDMLLSKQQGQHFYPNKTNDLANGLGSDREKRQTAQTGASFPINRWDPKVPISYYFDDSIPTETREIIRTALNFWQDNTCITFEENGKTKPRLEFFEGPGCFSEVGKDVSGKESQYVSIGSMCSFFAPIAHEIGHVLGMIHTQARPDRDDYINIERENVPAGMEDQFEKENKRTPSNILVPYDYASLMHYTSYNQQTGKVIMTAKDPRYQHTMGNTYGPIFSDILEINMQYTCGDFCKQSPNKICFNKGIRNPKNCSQCICPNGFGGEDCSSRSMGEGSAPTECGQILSATADYQTLHGEVNASKDGQLRQAGCHWHIRAAAGRRVEIVLNSTTGKCSNECLYGAIEIKFDDLSNGSREPDLSRGGLRLCCPSHVEKIGPIVSTGELVVISDYSQQGPRTFDLKYRAVPAISNKPVVLGESYSAGSLQNETEESNADYNDLDLGINTTSTSPTDGSWNPCADYSDKCELLKNSLKHSCEDQHNFHYFMFHCPLTCGLCPKNQQGETTTNEPQQEFLHLEDQPVMDYYNCINYAPRCDNYSSHCSNLQVAQICPKACKICGADETTPQPLPSGRRNRTDRPRTRDGKVKGNTHWDNQDNDESQDSGNDDQENQDSNNATGDDNDEADQGNNVTNTCEDKLGRDTCRSSRALCFQSDSQASMADLCSRTCGQCGKKNSRGGPSRKRGGANGTRIAGGGNKSDEDGSGSDDQESTDDSQDTGPPTRRSGRGGLQNNSANDDDGGGPPTRTGRGGGISRQNQGGRLGGDMRPGARGGMDGQQSGDMGIGLTNGISNSGNLPNIGNIPIVVAECNSDQRCINWNRSGICKISFMAPLRDKYCMRFCGFC